MPYPTNEDLPEAVKSALPAKAQDIWRTMFNETIADNANDEEAARKIAWGAVKNAFEKDENGRWIQKKDYAEKQKTHAFEAEIFSTGVHDGDTYTEQDLDDIVKNFAALKGVIKPPVKLSHWNKMHIIDGQPALGWVTALKKTGKKLVARFSDVPDVLYRAIKAKRYMRVSPEFLWNFKHGGKVFSRVLEGVGLLGANIPVVKDLADLTVFLSQSTDPANGGSGSFDRARVYSLKVDENGKLTDEKGEPDMGEIEDLKAKLAEEKAAREKAEADKKEYAEKLAAQAEKTAGELKKSRVAAFKAYCEDMVKAGKMLPVQRDVLTADLDKHVYAEDSGFAICFETFKEYAEKAEKVLDTKERAAAGGDGGGTDLSAGEEVDAKAKKYAETHKVNYGAAVTAVLREDADLAQRYQAEVNPARND